MSNPQSSTQTDASETPTAARTLRPGDRVRVTQQILRQAVGGGTMSTVVEGTVVKVEEQRTGSWFAHGKDDKLWLRRLELRADDGEQIVLNIDRNSVVELAGGAES